MTQLTTQPRSDASLPRSFASANGDVAAGSGPTIETIAVAGGAALIVFGAGLMMAHPGIRQLITTGLTRAMPDIEEPLKAGFSGLVTDLERYMKLRSM